MDEPKADSEDGPKNDPKDEKPAREYDKTGFYPENEKPFRIWALLGWNLGVIVLLAVVAAALNFILLD